MSTPIENWVFDSRKVSDRDMQALERAKKQDRGKYREGYRWFRVDARNQIYVPFKDGEPTEEGWRRIKKLKEYLRIE